MIFGVVHFTPVHSFSVSGRQHLLVSRLLCSSSSSFIIAPLCVRVLSDARRVAGLPLPRVREQGAAGSAGPRGYWPGRARVRHHSGGGRLVSAWPKSKEDVCRASPCSPSPYLSHSHLRAELGSQALSASPPPLCLWLAVASLKIIYTCIKINSSANEKSKLVLPSR